MPDLTPLHDWYWAGGWLYLTLFTIAFGAGFIAFMRWLFSDQDLDR